MKLDKFTKKIFKRELSFFELYSILSGIIIGSLTIFKINGNYIPLIFGVAMLILIGFFIKNKEKNIVLLSMISTIGWLLLINTAFPLTTVFNPNGLDIPPTTMQECQDIDGIAIPISGECSLNHVETIGTAGGGFICCLPDICKGSWKRIFNSETKIYERICNE